MLTTLVVTSTKQWNVHPVVFAGECVSTLTSCVVLETKMSKRRGRLQNDELDGGSKQQRVAPSFAKDGNEVVTKNGQAV